MLVRALAGATYYVDSYFEIEKISIYIYTLSCEERSRSTAASWVSPVIWVSLSRSIWSPGLSTPDFAAGLFSYISWILMVPCNIAMLTNNHLLIFYTYILYAAKWFWNIFKFRPIFLFCRSSIIISSALRGTSCDYLLSYKNINTFKKHTLL